MRYREIINELDEPLNWSANLGQVLQWIEILNRDNNYYTAPLQNDPIVIAGLVGDPKLKGRKSLAKAQEAFAILNQYKDGETISSQTKVRLIQTVQEIDNAYGWFQPDSATRKDAWVIMLQKTADSILKPIYQSYDEMQNAGTVMHEAMHRGIEIIDLLRKAGDITLEAEPEFCLYGSRYGLGPDGKLDRGVNGEHAMIYTVMSRGSEGRVERFITPWMKRNNEKLRSQFGIGTPEFNDEYVDLTDERDRNTELSQIILWLELAYNSAGRSLASVLGQKMVVSQRPRLRGAPAPKAPPPPPKKPEPEVQKLKAGSQAAVETALLNALKQLQADPSKAKSTQLQMRTMDVIVYLSGAKSQKHNELIGEIVYQLFNQYKTVTPQRIRSGVKVLYSPIWEKPESP